MSKKKPFRAPTPSGEGHCMKAGDTVEPARDFLLALGGGIIEKRTVKRLFQAGYGLGRVEFDPPLKVGDRQWLGSVTCH